MKSSPILMNQEMIRAYMAGRKTQTRRIVKNVPAGTDYYHPGWCPKGDRAFTPYKRTDDIERPERLGKYIKCPYGQPGDDLWFREGWATSVYEDDSPPRDTNHHGLPFWYRADGSVMYTGAKIGGPAFMTRGKWRPSIHMPKWASRFRSKITGIRVERVQDISPPDAYEEGMQCDCMNPEACKNSAMLVPKFLKLWQKIYGPGNPWVWVIEFERYNR